MLHALTDGTGATEFLRELVKNYLYLAHKEKELPEIQLSKDKLTVQDQENDSFSKYYNPDLKRTKKKKVKAYQIKKRGKEYEELKVVETTLSVKALLEKARAYGVSMTVLLTAAFICAIHKEMNKTQEKKPVVLMVPVNLRKIFPSDSMLNFFSYIEPGYQFGTGKDDFDTVLKAVKQYFEEHLTKEEIAERSNIKGVWFEEDYRRVYPLNSTASHLVGFTYTGNSADWGIEGYYSSTLNGVNGRQFGYYNSDADVEQNIIDPINGNSVESTIDLNIQQVVEKYISNFMDGMANGPRGAEGAANVGVIVANPKNGEILAMATDNPYDLNNPRDLTSYYSQDEINGMDNGTMLKNLYGIWKNYCNSDAFEPGSTVKPLTIGAALDADVVQPSDTFVCDGYQMFGGTRIRCSIYPGAHGTETLSDLIKHSCNDGLMQIGALLGPEEFLKYQKIFNFGATTGIDLPGEATGILHTEESLSSGSTELASASFGQGYTCTMIQEIAAICSVINGGNYYQPHVVSKI